MSKPYTQIYLHFVWRTWDRLPILEKGIRAAVFACLAVKCRSLGCEPVGIGGVEDHVHVLAEMSPSISPAKFVQELKGNSSHLITHKLKPGEFFKWQGGYGVFSVSKRNLDRAREYVLNQEAHHAEGTVYKELERVET